MDCANGAAWRLAPNLFRKFGAEIISINNTPDGRNINENCGSLHIENLQKRVLEERADFGVAFDGDADRSLFVDEKGNLVDGDAVLWIMANHLQAKGKLNNQTVVATVMSNIGLEIALNSKISNSFGRRSATNTFLPNYSKPTRLSAANNRVILFSRFTVSLATEC
jgi:phosphoglucosamine mutase